MYYPLQLRREVHRRCNCDEIHSHRTPTSKDYDSVAELQHASVDSFGTCSQRLEHVEGQPPRDNAILMENSRDVSHIATDTQTARPRDHTPKIMVNE
jgi:hypothetical protein